MTLIAGGAGPLWTDPTFWVAVSLAILVGYALKARVPSMMTKSLDERADAIRKELAEANRLKQQAAQLLEDYKKKQTEAETEAKAIIDNARREADTLAAETRRTLKESVERRTRIAEEKIARAEAQAVGEVRAAAVDAAISAAERLLADRSAGSQGAALIEQSLRDLKGRLN
jgi:F-type H+-transporting ATPase subunit b